MTQLEEKLLAIVDVSSKKCYRIYSDLLDSDDMEKSTIQEMKTLWNGILNIRNIVFLEIQKREEKMPLFQMTEFQRIARKNGYTVKVVGDYSYRKFNDPSSPFVKLGKTSKNNDNTYSLLVTMTDPGLNFHIKDVWITEQEEIDNG